MEVPYSIQTVASSYRHRYRAASPSPAQSATQGHAPSSTEQASQHHTMYVSNKKETRKKETLEKVTLPFSQAIVLCN